MRHGAINVAAARRHAARSSAPRRVHRRERRRLIDGGADAVRCPRSDCAPETAALVLASMLALPRGPV